MNRRDLLAAGAAALAARPAQAQQDWSPNRPLRMIVPFAAGGAADAGARLFAMALTEILGQPVQVDNRGGAAGATAAIAVAEAPADGHTLLWAGQAVFVTNPHLYARLPYRIADFVPVSMGNRLPMVLSVHPSFPARTLEEYIAHVRARPGEVPYATVGKGGMVHVYNEMLEAEFGLDMQDIPYRGSGPAMQDLLSGRVPTMVDGLIPDITYHRAGQLRILAITSDQRSPIAPDIPTFAELGHPGMTAFLWFGLFAHRATPPAALARLAGAMQQAAQRADVRERSAADGYEAVGGTPAEFQAAISREYELWGAVIRKAGIRLD
jgi:tripartite-type tricarboxylate transporter receptor subunit TctC